MTDIDKNAVRIVAANRAAQEIGIRLEQPLSDARAMLPDLKSEMVDKVRDLKTLNALRRWAQRYTPWVSIDTSFKSPSAEYGLWLDISGCAHLFGNEENLGNDLARRLAACGIEARIGIADTPGAAWAAAHFATHTISEASKLVIVAAGQQIGALGMLTIDALRLDAETVQLLRRLGLKRIEQIMELPRDVLARRFQNKEQAGQLLTRLDQFTGHLNEPIAPELPATDFRLDEGFPEPLISEEPLENALDGLLYRLCDLLQKKAFGARRLVAHFHHTDGGTSYIQVAVSRAGRDIHHFKRLFSEHLPKIDVGYGIDGMSLSAHQLNPQHIYQQDLVSFDKQAKTSALEKLADRLCNRLGEKNVQCLRPQQSHIPERAENLVSTLSDKEPVNHKHLDDTSLEEMRHIRPCRLLMRPEPISVIAEVPEGPPRHFIWRRMSYRLSRAQGPERIEAEWWRANDNQPPRDYYAVEDDRGHRFWLYREGLYPKNTNKHNQSQTSDKSPGWFIQGLFG